MKLTTTIQDNRAVLAVEGEFYFDSVMQFRSAASALAANPAVGQIEIDLGRSTYLDSSALGVLLTTREMARKGKKSVALTNCKGEVRQLLEVAKFGNLFSISP